MPSTAADRIRDRRANGRIPVNFPVEMQDLSFDYHGTAINLSPGGVRVLVLDSQVPHHVDLDVVLKPAGEAPVKLKGRVMHGVGPMVGVAFDIGDPAIFEAALSVYESIVFRDPTLAIRLKQRPTSLALTQRLWPAPSGVQMTGPEMWVLAKINPGHGSLLSELRDAIGQEWPHVAHVPFMLLEKGLISLTEPQAQADDTPGKPIPRQATNPTQASRISGSRPAVPAAPLPRQPTNPGQASRTSGSRPAIPAQPLPRQPTNPGQAPTQPPGRTSGSFVAAIAAKFGKKPGG